MLTTREIRLRQFLLGHHRLILLMVLGLGLGSVIFSKTSTAFYPVYNGAKIPSKDRIDQLASQLRFSEHIRPLSTRELKKRVLKLRQTCRKERGRWEQEYGRRNIARARTSDGSRARLTDVVRRVVLGEELLMSAIGGSVTNGHQISKNEIWFSRFTEWINQFLPADDSIKKAHRQDEAIEKDGESAWRIVEGSGDGWRGINGAVPATGSDYFSFCHSLHIPSSKSNLIFLELSINDEFLPEHTENMENLVRGLMDAGNQPAIIMVQALGLGGNIMAGGGDIHIPVGVYYDIPIITQRNVLAPHFMNNPDLIHPYFTTNWWQDPDVRHINARGHQDLANLAASLVQDVACDLVADEEDDEDDDKDTSAQIDTVLEALLAQHFKTQPVVPLHSDVELDKPELDMKAQKMLLKDDAEFWKKQPKQARPWGPWQKAKHPEGEEPRTWNGVWPGEWTMGQIPRLRMLQRWDDTARTPPLEPQCFSTRSTKYPLTPRINTGWSFWHHPDNPQKVYFKADQPGSRFTYDIETRLGTIKMYSLRSKTFGLGSIECWVGDDKGNSVRANGWWDNGDINIGRFTTIATGLSEGRHTVTCELLEETLDPDGGTEFRIISLMSL